MHVVASTGTDDAKLQERLATYAKVLFWSFVALLPFLFGMYAAYPEVEPANQTLIYAVAAIAFAILGFVWRVLLLRGQRSRKALLILDAVITIGSGCMFGTVACLAYDLNASAYTCLLYESFVVFTRALLIPSTSHRTMVISSLAFVPIVLGSVVLSILSEHGYGHLEIPPIAFVAGDILYNGVAVVLAMRGSDIIYELRRDVKKLGSYTLGRMIGSGGMGEVWEASHAFLRRPTAIKLLRADKTDREYFKRFEHEVQMTSKLTHPNTIAVFDYGRTSDGRPYYAMEYLSGINLQSLVEQHGVQPFDRVVHILAQVAGALAEAHRASLIHRDIKPGNIILCERGGVPDFVKVVDFGLVKDIASNDDDAMPAMGTPAYLAPEALDGSAVGAPSDIYALGVVGYFLLTKKPVFEGTGKKLYDQKLAHPPRPFTEVTDRVIPDGLAAIILKCLATSPPDRFASALDLQGALKALPLAMDWSAQQSLAFWEDFTARRKAMPSTDAPTETSQVNAARPQDVQTLTKDLTRDLELASAPSR